jgi:hypothetical protein
MALYAIDNSDIPRMDLLLAKFEMKGKRKHTFMMCLMSQCLLVYNIICYTIVCEYVQATPFLISLHL